MERDIHNKLRRRIHEVIAERGGFTPAPQEPEGGFLPLLAAAAPIVAPLAGKAMGWLGEKIFGSGDEEFDGAGDFYGEGKRAKRPANAHALKVKGLMATSKAEGRPISFIEASKLVAGKQVGAGKAPGDAPAKGRKPRKAPGDAPARGRKPRKAPSALKAGVAAFEKALQSDWKDAGYNITLKQLRNELTRYYSTA